MKITFESTNLSEPEVIIKGDITNEEVTSLLNYLKQKSAQPTKKLVLYKEDEQFIVTPNEIVYIEVTDNKVEAITLNNRFDTKRKLYEIKDMLSNEPFAQINKGTLVNIDFVKSVQAEFSGNYSMRLKDSKEILIISRKYFKEFKSKI